MKKKSLIAIVFLNLLSHVFSQEHSYFIRKSKVLDNKTGKSFYLLDLNTSEMNVKVKCFFSKGEYPSVKKRFEEWKKDKHIVAYSTAAYRNSWHYQDQQPVGLSVEDGILLNNQLVMDRLHGLAIVNATGEIAVKNIKDKNFIVTNADGTTKQLDITNTLQRNKFIKWAESNNATVFQTHLLVFNNELKVYADASRFEANRRFLISGKDADNNTHHIVINIREPMSLYDAATAVYGCLLRNETLTHVSYILNVDSGGDDIFGAFDEHGKVVTRLGFSGSALLDNAANLIVYYYE